MATTTFFGGPAVLTIGGTDFADQCTDFSCELGYDSLEVTAFGDTGHKMSKGLMTVSGSATLFASYGATEVEGVLAGLVGNGTTTIVFKKANAAEGADNPQYTITNTMISVVPFAYNAQEMQTFQISWEGGTWARDVTP
jgi:hypothetical protein